VKRRCQTLLPSNVITAPLVDFIIPTFDNSRMLLDCVQSLIENTQPRPFRILIANNGMAKSLDSLRATSCDIEIFDMGENKGWEGGINTVLPEVTAPFVCLLNDDTHFVPNDPTWLLRMVNEFRDPVIGAVGPSSNYVMQKQNIFAGGLPRRMNVPVLIGLCMMVRTDLLKSLGGLGRDLPGGDDLDLSMRIEKAGFKLRCLRSVFVYHHGAQTGRRVHGAYWDSEEHQDATNIELIRRNGFKNFMRCRYGGFEDVSTEAWNGLAKDAEGILVREYVTGNVILEMGCGGVKTVSESVGVDVFPKGMAIPSLQMSGSPQVSVADIVAAVDAVPVVDNYADCIIARHILEHMINPVKTLKEWDRILKPGGRLIIAVPDQDICSTIPLNTEHLHAYNQESLTDLVLSVLPRFVKVMTSSSNNGMSFTGVYDKAV
jgi:GT2 family glycosyltransferase